MIERLEKNKLVFAACQVCWLPPTCLSLSIGIACAAACRSLAPELPIVIASCYVTVDRDMSVGQHVHNIVEYKKDCVTQIA